MAAARLLKLGGARLGARQPVAMPLARTIWKPAGLAAPPPADDRELALAFVRERGYSENVSAAVVDSLASADWAPAAGAAGGVMGLAKRLAGRYEMGLDEGLHDLAKSLEIELAAKEGKQRVTFHVTPARGATFEIEALEGLSLKEVAEHADSDGARLLAEHLECACSGVMACSTCQLYVEDGWLEAVGLPTEEEEDMLDLAYDRRDNSRLGCQLVLRPELNGLRLAVPGGANNVFDHIPFE